MDTGITKSTSADASKAQHLCVLVHGLWGNPHHLDYVRKSLEERHGEDELVVYSAKRNVGSLTYDGIEIGAERVAKEIEDVMDRLRQEGHTINKFSIVGYSLGGLVARYVVGLLFHAGFFDKVTPINFTTFVTPHLGVRTPLLGYHNNLWNVLGARTLSTSGRQLFTIDDFRNTGRPLLSVLADPDSIFIHGLRLFRHRSLYTNVVNDRSAVYYTTGISAFDPYTDLEAVNLRYLKGYESVILDPDMPVERAPPKQDLPTFYDRVRGGSRTFVRRAPIVIALSLLIPVAITVFMINSGWQTFRSRRRIQLHESDSDGSFGGYRIPYLVREMRVGLEDAFETVNSSRQQEYLPEGSEELAIAPPSPKLTRSDTKDSVLSEKSEATTRADFPTLALTTDQFSMIKALDSVGWRKYPVHIQKSTHSHAAIIVRSARAAFEEGKTVVKHWLTEEFEV
ncbi:putative lipase [Cyphellophora attinorum]|uniref:Putative lipase n=1 Tax=Cyphellophora attinorum TaxID=1664694 RepID=A0A0N0NQ61_9EURO|nr:putative lipase [Phialophora attinorum]KPI43329.1 putative lipase [Phialophora attinorum]